MAAGGLAGLKTRELAREIGCANGAVYNLVDDMDELILLVDRGRWHGSMQSPRPKARARDRRAKRWSASPWPIAILRLKISNSGARCSSTG